MKILHKGEWDSLRSNLGRFQIMPLHEVPGLVRHVAADIPADDAVPRGVELFVELLLDVSRDILLDEKTFTFLF